MYHDLEIYGRVSPTGSEPSAVDFQFMTQKSSWCPYGRTSALTRPNLWYYG